MIFDVPRFAPRLAKALATVVDFPEIPARWPKSFECEDTCELFLTAMRCRPGFGPSLDDDVMPGIDLYLTELLTAIECPIGNYPDRLLRRGPVSRVDWDIEVTAGHDPAIWTARKIAHACRMVAGDVNVRRHSVNGDRVAVLPPRAYYQRDAFTATVTISCVYAEARASDATPT